MACVKQIIQIEQNIVKNLNLPEGNHLAIYKHNQELQYSMGEGNQNQIFEPHLQRTS